MIKKPFKVFHSAIENEMIASIGEYVLVPQESVFSPAFSEAILLWIQKTIKRTFDIMFALIFLLSALPLFFVIGIAIKLTSPGSVFFRQERVGYKGKIFKIWKFRTMYMDESAEEEHKAYVESLIKNEENLPGEVLAEKLVEYLDKRVTKIGRFLRASSLDELPQLLNVLWGDMSLVGPRPHPPYEVQSYKKWYARRLQVKPGLTGWSKLNLRLTPLNYEESILYDLWYVDNWNIGLDLRILVMTIPFILSMKQAT